MAKCNLCGRQMMASQKICQCQNVPGAAETIEEAYCGGTASPPGERGKTNDYWSRFTPRGVALGIAFGAAGYFAAVIPAGLILLAFNVGINYQGGYVFAGSAGRFREAVAVSLALWAMLSVVYTFASAGVNIFNKYDGLSFSERAKIFFVKVIYVCTAGLFGAMAGATLAMVLSFFYIDALLFSALPVPLGLVLIPSSIVACGVWGRRRYYFREGF